MIWRACLFWLAMSLTVHAQEFLTAETALNDDDFYAMVSCAAPPQGVYGKRLVRGPKTDLTIGITKMGRTYLGGKKIREAAAIVRAIAEINAAGSAIRLTRDDVDPDIAILFLNIPARSAIKRSGYPVLEGTPISAAGVRVFSKDGTIFKSVILFTTGLQKRAYESVMLEEIVQGLGFLTDIGGTYYETHSILSQTSNALTKLGSQDIMALGRHYPAR